MKPFEVKGSKVLVFGDWHMDINWVKTILEKEKGNFDQIISLGDEVDSFFQYPVVGSIYEVVDFVKELIDQKYGPYYQLIANHTSPILESYKFDYKSQNPKRLQTACSGYTRNKSKEWNKRFNKEYWLKFEPFCVCNGFILSHAGITQKYWNFDQSVDKNLDDLYTEFSNSIKKLLNTKEPIDRFFDCGFERGGNETVGGPTWLGWECFADCLPLKQICGHSESYNHIRKVGRSYCIDGSRTTYAILHDDGKLDLKSTKESFALSVDGKTIQF